jgi:hypothetical protein
MRTKRFRIEQRQRVIDRAKKVLKLNGLEEKYAAYWADNLCKCSCHLCQPDGIKSQYQAVLNEPLLQTSQQ